jgi:pimeloyl-ACP methyl ester carboxylesterase
VIAPALYHKIAGSGPHVVLLHPVGLDLTFLEPVAAELCRSFTVLSVDLRGNGHSPASPPARSLDDYADDVHVLLGARGFAPAAVAGFSFGGMVAQHLALKYPKDVSALAICATLDRWFTPEFRASGAADAARDRLLSDNVMAWAQAWRAMAAIDTSARLGAIQVPTLCLAGEIDKSSPPEIVAAIAEQIAGARFAVIPGAPHMLFIEQPRAVARVIGDFLAGL